MKFTPAYALVFSGFASVVFAEEEHKPTDQHVLNQLVVEDAKKAFKAAFDAGDELTEISFKAEHGIGANIGEGRRFTRFPRADLNGPREWANHFPKREGGANATSCIACHNAPFANGAGDIAVNVAVDPAHTGNPSKYLVRNTLPLFALGVPQRLAEEMSTELYLQRDAATAQACKTGTATATLSAKGVSFGMLNIMRSEADPCKVDIDTSKLAGIDDDLVIKAFGWKGNHATIRAFTRSAAHNELGMQAVELVGDKDGDFDGITQELTVGDITALAIYMAGLERPVSSIELADLGLIKLSDLQRADILKGETVFAEIGCNSCHVSTMTLNDTTFSEPSRVAGFYDIAFPDGSDPAVHGLTEATAMTFDLKADQPNNQIKTKDGKLHLLGALQPSANGSAIVRWYTDFKRHDMGPQLSDPDNPLGLGASMFLTRSLAGVGVTGPWLHDGRATTLSDAISMHGGVANESAARFNSLPEEKQGQIIAFLESLVLYESKDKHD
jgi:hypothetical protein